MLNIRLIKGRIKSAKNIAQITKAMELVAASKMKKAQALAASGKLYANRIYELVMQLGANNKTNLHPLLLPPKSITGKKLVIFISTNKGLCGGLNANLNRHVLATFGNDPNVSYITLGKKAALLVARLKSTLLADFSDRVPFANTVPALTELMMQEFLAHRVDSVHLVYSEFMSALRQEAVHKQIIPLSIVGDLSVPKISGVQLIEPDAETVFNELIPHYLENQLRDAILQADASEHSARMVAMRNATDNAKGLISDLTLLHNKARQEKITSEILDMVTARSAVEV